jgi:hypothetical protein
MMTPEQKAAKTEYQRRRRAEFTPEQWEKERAKGRRYRAKLTPERRTELAQAKAGRRRASNNPGRRAAESMRMRLWRHGLTRDQYGALLATQDRLCAICGARFTDTPHIDHDHESGVVRGLLCGQCNVGIGMFHDDPDVVYAASLYLRRHSSPIRRIAS